MARRSSSSPRGRHRDIPTMALSKSARAVAFSPWRQWAIASKNQSKLSPPPGAP